MNNDKLIANIAIIYFIIGLIFAVSFALYYKWSGFSFFSPGFFAVVFTWPVQMPGFLSDFSNYGLAGKPI